MLNTFSGIGRLGNDPETSNNNGTKVTRFELAINEFYKQNNDLQKRTHWIPCVTYGRLAEIVMEFCGRGNQVGVRGPITLKEWTDGNGNKTRGLEVHVLELKKRVKS